MAILFAMAMPQELKGICRVLKNVKKHNAHHYSAKTLSGDEMILVATGIGAIQTALSIASYAARYDISEIVMLGVGGGLQKDQQIGELVVAKRIIAHDSCVYFDEGRFLVRPSHYLADSSAAKYHDHYLYSDEGLQEFTSAIAGVKYGDILSGSEISLSYGRKSELATLYNHSLLIEMEGVGVALAAQSLDVPFMIAKAVADRLIESTEKFNTMDDFKENFSAAIASAARLARLWQDYK